MGFSSFGGFIVPMIFIFLLLGSCRRVYVIDGRYEIISRTVDSSLADSVLLIGKVVGALDNLSPRMHARIWTDELSKETYSDNSGTYSLRLSSGTYTINCKENGGSDQFKETIKALSLLPNERVEINFYLGMTIE